MSEFYFGDFDEDDAFDASDEFLDREVISLAAGSRVYLNGEHAGFPSLEVVLRNAGFSGSDIVWGDNWKYRSRSSGGFPPGVGPMAIVVHHTASGYLADANARFLRDFRFCNSGHPDAPVGNVVLGSNGRIGINAAGAANTQGKGGPWTTSKGVVPQDMGNSMMFAVEACNNGMGEEWPKVMQDAYVAFVTAFCKAYNLRTDRWGKYASDILSHFEWVDPSCPGRKCDPAGPALWSPTRNGGCDTRNLWVMDGFRQSIAEKSVPVPPVPPTPERKHKVNFLFNIQDDKTGALFISDGYQRRWIWDGNELNALLAAGVLSPEAPGKVATVAPAFALTLKDVSNYARPLALGGPITDPAQ